jgi:hypothetical protein
MGIKRVFFHTSLGAKAVGAVHPEKDAFNRHSGVRR